MLISSCGIQKNKKITDSKSNKNILIGKCNRKAFDNENFKSWFSEKYDNYDTNKEIIDKLKNSSEITDTKILIVFGTWCGDSRRELPRFYKIADEVGYSKFNIDLVGVDRNRSSGKKLLEDIEFTRIPTFIFYREGKEIGRIVESVEVSLESDIFEILNK